MCVDCLGIFTSLFVYSCGCIFSTDPYIIVIFTYVRYLLGMETKSDIEDYLEELLDKSNPSHEEFIAELMRRCLHAKDVVPEGVTVTT